MARLVVRSDLADALAWARAERDRRLAASDWTQAPDNRLTDVQRAAWRLARAEWRAVVDDIKAGVTPRPWAAEPV